MKFIEDFREGDAVNGVYLVKKKSALIAKNGRSYDSLILQDKTGTVDAKIWDPGSVGIEDFSEMDYVDIVGEVTFFRKNISST
jgi:Predicted HD-superfamily hydrolase